MQLTSHFQVHQTEKVSKWPNLCLWALLFIPLLHSVLLVGLHDLQSEQASLVHQLRPLGTFGAMIMLFYVASLSTGRHRWAWTFQAVAMLFSTIFSFLRVAQHISVATPLLKALVVLIYLCALIGTAFYLQQRAWWLGSTWRVIIAGTAVGVASLVLMQALLPRTFASWPWNPQISTTMAYLAFDIGMLFAFSLISVRYQRNSSPLLPFVILGLLCLLIADTLYMLLSWMPNGQPFQVAILPVYTLHSILLAFAGYRDVTLSTEQSAPPEKIMPLSEWLLWTQIPFLFVLAAFAAAGFSGTAPALLLAVLIVVAVIYETLAVFDYRRVWHALYDANRQLTAYATSAEERATLEERNRLAREIHDGLGHYLTKINMQLNAAVRLLPIDQADAMQSLQDAQMLSQEALTDVRQSVEALRTGPTGYRPLVESLTELVGESQAAEIDTTFEVIGEPRPLDAQTELTLYRIIQEGLTNVRKHAQAEHVDIELTYSPAAVHVLLCDDGQGATGISNGFGLLGMRERVNQLGGTMQVYTAPNQGFTLKIEVPA